MRFKVPSIEITVLTVAAAYILHLAVTGRLSLYIHPRYIVFTAALSLVGLLVLFAGSANTHPNKQEKGQKINRLSLLPIIIVLIAAIFVPARPLSSATVAQRTIDSGSLVTTADAQPVSALFAGSSRGLKLSDWSRLLATQQDPVFYSKKPAKISGFVYDAGLGDDVLALARFVVTCCAVDAQPVVVPVYIESWRTQYDQDKWIEVEGVFQLSEEDPAAGLRLVPDSVTPIDIPRNPYAS